MVVVIVVMMAVVIVVGLPARSLRGPGLGALDGGHPHERVGAEHNATADRLTGRRVLRQRGLFDGLKDFVTPHRLSGARQGFILNPAVED